MTSLLLSRSVDRLTPEQRKGVEETLIRALRLRYPGCAVTVDWDGDDDEGDVYEGGSAHASLGSGHRTYGFASERLLKTLDRMCREQGLPRPHGLGLSAEGGLSLDEGQVLVSARRYS